MIIPRPARTSYVSAWTVSQTDLLSSLALSARTKEVKVSSESLCLVIVNVQQRSYTHHLKSLATFESLASRQGRKERRCSLDAVSDESFSLERVRWTHSVD